MNPPYFQQAEILTAAKAAFEQGAINLGRMPDDDTWNNMAAENKERWCQIVLAALQTLGFNRPQIKATKMDRH